MLSDPLFFAFCFPPKSHIGHTCSYLNTTGMFPIGALNVVFLVSGALFSWIASWPSVPFWLLPKSHLLSEPVLVTYFNLQPFVPPLHSLILLLFFFFFAADIMYPPASPYLKTVPGKFRHSIILKE